MFISSKNINKLTEKEITHKYGKRALRIEYMRNLTKKKKNFSVPNAMYLSKEIPKKFHLGQIQSRGNTTISESIFEPNEELVSNLFKTHTNEIINLSRMVNDCHTRQILRSFSTIESIGKFPHLSFAGYCRSKIPPSKSESVESMSKRIAEVLVGWSSEYGEYYENIHRLDSSSREISICSMDYINNYFSYGTIYLSNGFLGLMLKSCNDEFDTLDFTIGIQKSYLIKREIDKIVEDNTIRDLTLWLIEEFIGWAEALRGMNASYDFEFVITEDINSRKIHIFQDRDLSLIHDLNYKSAANSDISKLKYGFKSLHLLHSSHIQSKKYLMLDENSDTPKNTNENVLFLLDHGSGRGTLELLKRINYSDRVSLILKYNKNEKYDHFRYSIYEDPRIENIYNINSNESNHIATGFVKKITSNGKFFFIS